MFSLYNTSSNGKGREAEHNDMFSSNTATRNTSHNPSYQQPEARINHVGLPSSHGITGSGIPHRFSNNVIARGFQGVPALQGWATPPQSPVQTPASIPSPTQVTVSGFRLPVYPQAESSTSTASYDQPTYNSYANYGRSVDPYAQYSQNHAAHNSSLRAAMPDIRSITQVPRTINSARPALNARAPEFRSRATYERSGNSGGRHVEVHQARPAAFTTDTYNQVNSNRTGKQPMVITRYPPPPLLNLQQRFPVPYTGGPGARGGHIGAIQGHFLQPAPMQTVYGGPGGSYPQAGFVPYVGASRSNAAPINYVPGMHSANQDRQLAVCTFQRSRALSNTPVDPAPEVLQQLAVHGISPNANYHGEVKLENMMLQADQNCALFITGIPAHATTADVFAQISEGGIYNYSPTGTGAFNFNTGAAQLAFKTREAAVAFFTRASNSGIYVHGERLNVAWNRNRSPPLDDSQMRQTRVLRIWGPENEVNSAEIKALFSANLRYDLVAEQGWSQYSSKRSRTRRTIRVLELSFASILGQSRQAMKCFLDNQKAGNLSENLHIWFAHDPCESRGAQPQGSSGG